MEAPEYFVGGYYGAGGQDQFSPAEKRHTDQKPGEPFAIDDLFDFSNADAIMSDGFFDNVAGNSTDSSTVTAVDSCNSSISGGDNRFAAAIVPRGFASDLHLSGELCVPVIIHNISQNFNLNWNSNKTPQIEIEIKLTWNFEQFNLNFELIWKLKTEFAGLWFC